MKRGLFVGFSLAAHLSIFLALHSAAMTTPPIKRKPIQVAIVDHPPPPPEPPKEKPKVVPKVVKQPEAAPPKNEPPPPPVFGLSLDSTDAGGSFAAPVGNTTLAEPTKNPPKEVRPLQGNGHSHAPMSLAQLSKLPEKIGECPPGNPSALYTQSARDAGIEGDVVVETVLDDDGHVTKTRVVRGIGYGLDDAASKAIREQCKFKPAEVNGDKVGTTITLTFHFIIDE